MDISLKGKRALVTGANSGIGRAIALALGAAGARVAINFVTAPEQADEVVAAIMAAGSEAVAIKADVSDAAQVAAMFAQLDASFGGIDILVNNAGIDGGAALTWDADPDKWCRVRCSWCPMPPPTSPEPRSSRTVACSITRASRTAASRECLEDLRAPRCAVDGEQRVGPRRCAFAQFRHASGPRLLPEREATQVDRSQRGDIAREFGVGGRAFGAVRADAPASRVPGTERVGHFDRDRIHTRPGRKRGPADHAEDGVDGHT